MKIAIIGSGISGLAAAHTLRHSADISLFEAGSYFGGHTHTVDVELKTEQGSCVHGVDTGFLVFNERTYPNLIALLKELEVETCHSDMSFSVQAYERNTKVEWGGSNLNSVFAQRSNLLKPKFWGMLNDLMRFNKLATELAQHEQNHQASAELKEQLRQPLSAFLKQHQFGEAFINWYLLPMLGCIWSCPTEQMLAFPVATMVRFCHNHGLLQVNNRPQWWTVKGGAKHYVEKIVSQIQNKYLATPVVKVIRLESGKVEIFTEHTSTIFDAVILATHSDQSLKLLEHVSSKEKQILGAIQYQANIAVLHKDESVMPNQKIAWSAWNYDQSNKQNSTQESRVCLHYWLNLLQPLPSKENVFVSLNPNQPIKKEAVIGQFEYAHPVFDLAAIEAQNKVPEIQGLGSVYYAGAWMGYGFHEDGLKAGVMAAQKLLADFSAKA
jgi:predicted NAD/FAD-binding protein